MAEKGAHITANLQNKPSIFEVVAQDSLNATINPALKQVVLFLASQNPEKYSWLLKCFDEVYLGLNAIIQHNYLKYYAASFAEAFYGLQRVALTTTQLKRGLPHREKMLSLTFLVIFPYLRTKLENLATKYKLEQIDNLPIDEKTKWWRSLVIRAHSSLHMVWESAVLVYYLSYMSGNSTSHSPMLHLAGVTLNHMPEQEEPSVITNLTSLFRGKLRLSVVSLRLMGQMLMGSVELGAFFVQFLQYWYSEQQQPSITTLPIPSAPKISEKGELYANKCPICLQARKIDTALSVSGFVFCYRCIATHLKNSTYCPVTGYPATTDDLIRLYD